MIAKKRPELWTIGRAWFLAGLWWLLLAQPAPARAADLTLGEIQQIARFDRAPSLRDTPAWARAEMEPKAQAAYREARALFAGRGPEVARHFVTHTEYPPASEAYFFVLEAVADVETALVLIRALWDSPRVASGPTLSAGGRAWPRERDKAEIHWAIASVLVDESVRSDPRVVSGLLDAISRLRPERRELGPGDAARVVELLGRCAGADATAALQGLAGDADASIRGLAIQGLGQAAGPAGTKDSPTTLATLARSLGSDPEPRARVEAAAALAGIGAPESVPTLRAALQSERHPAVTDALLLALERLKALPTDPEACGELAGRAWEAHAARFPFACWRAAASREALREAAISGPLRLRALALHALAQEAAEHLQPQPYLLFPPLAAAPPPPLAARPGARAIVSSPIQPPAARPRPAVELDADTRQRLLASAVDLLSRPSAGIPDGRSEISSSSVLLVRDALWQLAGREMATALGYADRVSTPGARHVMQGRYGASYDLWHKDRAAYLGYRRPRQAGAGALLAAAFGVLLAWRRTRRAGAALVTMAFGWSLWSLFATQLRELPPPPLQFLTLGALAFFSAGVSVAALASWPQTAAAGGPMRALARASAATALASVLAFFACGYARWSHVFPIGGEGWELVFDPIGSAILAAMVAMALATLDGVLWRRLFT